MDLSYFKNRKILVTGHTGFKGSWLTEMLLNAGADMLGYSLEPPTYPSLFEELGLKERLKDRSVEGDVRDFEKLYETFQTFQPEFVIHLAAQPIVRESYKNPRYTYETNVLGTVNLMECIRLTPSVISVLNVTTDKVYLNTESGEAMKEDDPLDGYDPYSNSKSCSELVTHSYTRSFLKERGCAVSTARAGNVIGGGDYAPDRILPDCVRAAESGQDIILRNPYSVRPYQHVLEPLAAYLMILKGQAEDISLAGSYNVGPDEKDCLETGALADIFISAWGGGIRRRNLSDGGPHEAGFLRLDNEKIRRAFGWKPVWSAEAAVRKIAEYAKSTDKRACVDAQIDLFLKGMTDV